MGKKAVKLEAKTSALVKSLKGMNRVIFGVIWLPLVDMFLNHEIDLSYVNVSSLKVFV